MKDARRAFPDCLWSEPGEYLVIVAIEPEVHSRWIPGTATKTTLFSAKYVGVDQYGLAQVASRAPDYGAKTPAVNPRGAKTKDDIQ